VKQYLEYLESFVVIALVLFAIGGISYHLFRDNGWVETLAGNLWDVSIQYPLIALPVIVAAVFLGRKWNEARIMHGRATQLPDYFIYVLMAAGLVFIGRYLWYGSF